MITQTENRPGEGSQGHLVRGQPAVGTGVPLLGTNFQGTSQRTPGLHPTLLRREDLGTVPPRVSHNPSSRCNFFAFANELKVLCGRVEKAGVRGVRDLAKTFWIFWILFCCLPARWISHHTFLH